MAKRAAWISSVPKRLSNAPRTVTADWFSHVYRERNKKTDELCNRAKNDNRSSTWVNQRCSGIMLKLCAHFDGGKRGDTTAACGWHMQGSPGTDASGQAIWITLAWASVLLDPRVTTVEAELEGLREATHAILSWAETSIICFEDCRVQ